MAASEGRLRTGSIGLIDVVFQSITYMAPGTGLVFAIGVGIPFVGNALPLAVIVALVACTLAGVAIGQMAKYIPSAGGIYTYAAKGLNPKFGFYVGYLYLGFATFLPPFLFTLNGFLIDSTLKDQGWWEGSPGWWFWTAITIAVVFCLTYFDVRLSGKAGVILGAIEIGVFVALSLTILGEKGLSSVPFDPSSATSSTGIFQAAVLGILAFIGFEASSALGEEARNPSYTCGAASSTRASAWASTTCSAPGPGRSAPTSTSPSTTPTTTSTPGCRSARSSGARPGCSCSSR